MSFDARHPNTPTLTADPAHTSSHLAVARLRPDLLHKVGETFAVALSRLQARLTTAANGSLEPAVLQAALAEVARLERLGVQVQEVAHVLAGEGSWATERVDVAAALRQVREMVSDKAALSGVSLDGPEGACEAEVNAAVLGQLLQLGMEYALPLGNRVTLRCAVEGEPPCPQLGFAIQRDSADWGVDVDDLAWQLFSALARASGWLPRRQIVGKQLLLSLTLGLPEEAAVRSAALLPTTPVAVGRRVLLVDPQEISRVQAQRLLREVGMHVDAAASVEQAWAGFNSSLHPQPPDVLLSGFATDTAPCSALIDALRSRQPRLRVVELVDDDSAFAFSVPGSDNPARVGRHTLQRTLVSAISQELDAV
jgi:CheY-like chemotaxis protein